MLITRNPHREPDCVGLDTTAFVIFKPCSADHPSVRNHYRHRWTDSLVLRRGRPRSRADQTFADGYLLFGLIVNCLCFLDNLLVYMDVHEVSLLGVATGLPFRYNCVTENDGVDVAWGNGTRTDVHHGFAFLLGGGGCVRTSVTWTMFAFWNLLHLYLLFDVKVCSSVL